LVNNLYPSPAEENQQPQQLQQQQQLLGNHLPANKSQFIHSKVQVLKRLGLLARCDDEEILLGKSNIHSSSVSSGTLSPLPELSSSTVRGDFQMKDDGDQLKRAHWYQPGLPR
jgi:hypothetical protein